MHTNRPSVSVQLPYAVCAWLISAVVAATVMSGCNMSLESGAESGSAATVPAKAVFPDLPAGQEIRPGIMMHEVVLKSGEMGKVWIYLPKQPAAEKLPCVLIAPAGSYGFRGMKLSESDQPEHFPYVFAGMAVVAYALDGHVEDMRNEAQLSVGVQAYMASEAGLRNASSAIDYVQQKVPSIDMNRIFAVGHSSAATIAMSVAAREPRIRGCVAYAPGWTDLKAQLHPEVIRYISANFADGEAFLSRASPNSYVTQFPKPLLLFHANDDSTVALSQTANFYDELQRKNAVDASFVSVNSGGHYESMIQEGIPAAILWMRARGSITAQQPSSTPSISANTDSNTPSSPSDPTTVNLLARVNPQRDQVRGNWSMEGGILVSPVGQADTLVIPDSLPPQYRLTVVAERLEGNDSFNIGLVVGGRQTMLVLEGWGARASGLNTVDGRTADNNATTYSSPIFAPGRATTIVCDVRATSVRATCDGRTVVNWEGDARRLDLDRRFWTGIPQDRLFLGTWNTRVRITKIELKPLEQ
jgi:dienelactone hydrolase